MSASFRLPSAVAFLIALPLATAVLAAPQRTFVASKGLDTNPCSLASPCRSFDTAIGAVADGGEVIVLDSAGYGAAVIAKAVSLIAPRGVYAGVTVASGDGIVINGAGIRVVLEGLSITGLGGAQGIAVIGASSVLVTGVTIQGMTGAAVRTTPSLPTDVVIVDSTLRNNGAAVQVDDNTRLTLVGSRVEKNASYGVYVAGQSAAEIIDTVIENGGGAGVFVDGVGGKTAMVAFERCTIAGNGGEAVVAHTSGTSIARLTVSRSSMQRNLYGVVGYAVAPNAVQIEVVDNVLTDIVGSAIGGSGNGVTIVARGNTAIHNQYGLVNDFTASFKSRGDNVTEQSSSATTYGPPITAAESH